MQPCGGCSSAGFLLICPPCLQLAGTGVLAVGLWLRFDSKTAGLFEATDSPPVFFTGEKRSYSRVNAPGLHVGTVLIVPGVIRANAGQGLNCRVDPEANICPTLCCSQAQ